jgi:hypothetical protein
MEGSLIKLLYLVAMDRGLDMLCTFPCADGFSLPFLCWWGGAAGGGWHGEKLAEGAHWCGEGGVGCEVDRLLQGEILSEVNPFEDL